MQFFPRAVFKACVVCVIIVKNARLSFKQPRNGISRLAYKFTFSSSACLQEREDNISLLSQDTHERKHAKKEVPPEKKCQKGKNGFKVAMLCTLLALFWRGESFSYTGQRRTGQSTVCILYTRRAQTKSYDKKKKMATSFLPRLVCDYLRPTTISFGEGEQEQAFFKVRAFTWP